MNYYSTELYHHGVLGQKWGVRRFQNEDGSLTPEGRQHYYGNNGNLTEEGKRVYAEKLKMAKAYNKSHDNGWLDKAKKNAGIESVDQNTDVIRKGNLKMRRLAGSDDKVDTRRKYISMLDHDNQEYDSAAEFLPIGGDGHVYEYKYSTKKDVKVATAKAVSDYIVDKYGDVKAKDVYKVTEEKMDVFAKSLLNSGLGDKTIKEIYKDYDDYRELKNGAWGDKSGNYNKKYDYSSVKDNQWVYDRAEAGERYMTSFFSNKMFKDEKTFNDISNHFSKKGYDAIIDVEDFSSIADYPVILLDPSKSVKEESRTQRW